MVNWQKLLGPISVLGFLLIGPGECNPDAATSLSGEIRPQGGPIPVGATDPDGDPSQPRPSVRHLSRSSR